ncbi:MAG: hypothetical protein ACREKI_07125, partial [Gemmatimonadota bacterium]
MNSPSTLAFLAAQQAPSADQGLSLVQIWVDGGFMMWPLGFCALAGLVIIVWKFLDLQKKARATRAILNETDSLI